MSIYRTKRRIEFCDTDMAGIVHFSNFFRFMESAEVEMLRSLGLSVRMELNGQHIGFPRISTTCDYRKPARFEDLVDVAVSLERLGDKSVTYGFEFSRNGEVLANSKMTSVCCRVNERKELQAIAIPEDYRRRLESFFQKQSIQ